MPFKNFSPLLWFFCVFSIVACSRDETSKDTLFQNIPSSESGITFENTITNSEEFNIFNYRNFYNGGGVAIGDINNDDLPDVYLIANQGANKLFLNKGNFKFEDITESAGVAGTKSWSTGATFADINGDGLLDLYVCNAGRSKERANELFLNLGNGKFVEKAKEYGLADEGYSTHAAFFDMDRDGDLDMFLLNNSFTPVGRLAYANLRSQRDKEGGHKLFRNDGEKFVDISEQAGIYGSIIGFGLGITIGDVNDDNWLDLYISNDFYEHDYLYINNQNGTFTESLQSAMGHTSHSSMGADIADINNDGKLDIYVTDMLPPTDRRLKLTSTFEGHDLMELKISRDFHYQYMQNSLQLNQSGGPGSRTWFSEIARFTGTEATDWSWGALIFDMDSDGEKDIFVANGISKDLTNQDFVSYLADPANMEEVSRTGKFDYKQFLDKMPSEPIPNYAFKNNGGLSFKNMAKEWGLGTPSFSNGAAYGDLDNDGDQDLIVNNANSPLFVYRNTSNERNDFHYVKFKLKGEKKNLDAIGAKVYVHQKDRTQLLQQMPNRGFESSVDLRLIFGLGANSKIDSVSVIWPGDKQTVLKNVLADTTHVLFERDAKASIPTQIGKKNLWFSDDTKTSGIDFVHKEAPFVDYNQNPLLKQMYSRLGPALAVGDINGDGLEDVFIGGAIHQKGKLYMQEKSGSFRDVPTPWLTDDIESTDAAFFDADGDKDLDLLIVSGSNEFKDDDDILLPKLFINNGKGEFTKSNGMPSLKINASTIAIADFDRDGDNDIFVGSRLKADNYGIDPPSYLLTNDGTGTFKNYTKRFIPEIGALGMVTDATWADLDGDSFPELIVVGDWMPITIFKNQRNKLTLEKGLRVMGRGQNDIKTNGWWNSVEVFDVDQDGDQDIVAGNLGLNTRLRASQSTPVEMYVKDFDNNGVMKQIITCPDESGKSYPMVMRPDLLRAMPSLKKKFVRYEQYAGKTIEEVIDKEVLETAIKKSVYTSASVILRNDGKGNAFTFIELPEQAQLSSINAILPTDINHDGLIDLVIAGNNFDVLPEIGRYDGLKGLVLINRKDRFEVLSPWESGLWAEDQVRRIIQLKQGQLILGRNNSSVQVFKPLRK